MKRASMHSLTLLMLLAATAGAEDKPASTSGPRFVRVEKCKIALLDQVTLASDRSGILKHVEYKEGDAVARGNRVVLIADDVAQANYAADQKKATNEVEVKFATVAMKSAEAELEVLNKAIDLGKENGGLKGIISQLEVIKAELALDKAKLSLEQAKHELALNKLKAEVTAAELKTYSVLSEFDGVITKIYKKKGEAVRQGDPVADVVNTDRVRIEGKVALNDLRYAKQGAKVFVRLNVEGYDLPEENEVFEGRITFVDLVSSRVTRETSIYAEVLNRDNILRAGLSAEMEIEIDDTSAGANNRPVHSEKASAKVPKASSAQ